MSYASGRRERLLQWMRTNQGWPSIGTTERRLTARQLVDASGVYDDQQHYRYDRCFDDLKVLHRDGLVGRKGRPTTWWAR